MNELVKVSLLAVRLACDALIMVIDQALAADEPATTEDGACTHPVEARVNNPVMGHPGRFTCRACNQTVE